MAVGKSDMDSIREELSSQFSEIERRVEENSEYLSRIPRKFGESKGADSSRKEDSSIEEDNLIGVSASESGARLLDIDREMQELCNELTALVASGSYDIPKSTLHGLFSLFRALSLERSSVNLRKMKAKQQNKALLNKIAFLDAQMKSMEKALKGVENKLEKIENPERDSTGLSPKLQEEYTNSRELLHEMIDKLYPDDEGRMKNLLKDLTVAHFSSEENQWVDVSRHDHRHVEQLLRYTVIESKPKEPLLVRFCI